MARDEAAAERTIQLVLRAGLAVAVTAMTAGVVVRAATGHRDAPELKLFDLASTPMDAGERMAALGILVLALTPAARVIALVVIWTRARDRRFAAIAWVVALLLAVAVAVGHG